MFGRIGPEFQCLKKKKQNSNNWKVQVGILMFRRITSEFNSHRWKDKVRILMFVRIRSQFECLEG